jgi:hypothetical protein
MKEPRFSSRAAVFAVGLMVGLAACKSSKDTSAGASAKADAAAPGVANVTKPAAEVDTKGIPPFPEGQSAPPSPEEWSTAREVNTQDPSSRAKDCYLKVIREWLKVHCDGDIKSVGETEGMPKSKSDSFESVEPGKAADFVMRLTKGSTIKMRIHRAGNRASFFEIWPVSADRPTMIAIAQIKEGLDSDGGH